MRKKFKKCLAPPIFEDDEEKTWHASLINATILVYLGIIFFGVIGNLIGGRIQTSVYIVDAIAFLFILLLRRLLFTGRVSQTGVWLISSTTLIVTVAIASLGTIRTPTTMAFLISIIISGLIFGRRGLFFSITSSSLAVLGLIVAEKFGVLPPPDYVVNITQWITTTLIFSFIGGLVNFSYRSTRYALKRSIEEVDGRKKTEKALQESEEKYRLLFESSPDAIFIRDTQKILHANASCIKMVGAKTLGEIVGTQLENYMSKEVVEKINIRTEKMVLTGEPAAPMEANYHRLDGTPFTAEDLAIPIVFEGKPAFQVITRDITKRKETEKALQESEVLLKNAQKLAHIGSWKLDLRTNELTWSDEVYRIFGLEPQAFGATYESFLDTIHPDDRKMVAETYEISVQEKQPYDLVHRILRPDGIIRTVHEKSNSILNEAGEVIISIGFVHDITERIQKDKIIYQLSRVVEQSASTIVITDLDGNIEFTNPAFKKITGYTAEEALGENPRILKSNHTAPEVYVEMWDTLLAGDVWQGELLNRKKDGKHYWELATIFPIKDNMGEITHFAAVKDDITSRKKIELDLKESEEKFRSLVEQSEDGIVIVTQSGIIIEWNLGMSNITGLAREYMLGTLLWESLYQLVRDECKNPTRAERMKAGICAILKNKNMLRNEEKKEYIIQRSNGEIRTIQSTAYPIAVGGGFMVGIISRDITEQKKSERALEESETRFRGAFENTSVGMSLTTPRGNILKVNDALCNIIGYSAEELHTMTFWDFTHPDDMKENRKLIEKLSSGELSGFKLEKRYIHKEGHLVWVLLNLVLVRGEQNNPLYSIILTQDITERKKAESELNKLAQAVNFSGSSIMITDSDGKIEFANEAFSAVSGYSVEEIIGEKASILKSGKVETKIYEELWGEITQGNIWRGELLNRKKTGELYWDAMVISPIIDKDNNITHYVAVQDEITERKEEEYRLIHLATHDILTNLPNRAFFNERIKHALALAKRNNWQVALFFIDLNDFKIINDKFGHNVGDNALLEFAKRLQASVRNSDTAVRLGGDEFVCLLENIPAKEDLALIAEKIIANIKVPFDVNEELRLELSTSIGISIFPQDGENIETLLEKADHAMYNAKNEKAKGYKFYNASNGALLRSNLDEAH